MSNDTKSGKVKIYHNKQRDIPDNYKPYVPQYQLNGIEPAHYQGAVVPSNTQVARPTAVNPREGKRPSLRQPYAEAVNTPAIGVGKGKLPNVGNNLDQNWVDVDNQLIEDFDPNQPMIDNNDVMTDQALGQNYQNGFTAQDLSPPSQYGKVNIVNDNPLEPNQIINDPVSLNSHHQEDELLSIVSDLQEELYLLIVSGAAICSGPKEEIEDQARAFIFGEHQLCEGNPTPIEEVLVLKKVKIKVGLFLE